MTYDLNRMEEAVRFCRTVDGAHDQTNWGVIGDGLNFSPVPVRDSQLDGSYRIVDVGKEELLSCGTTACCAGWTVLLEGDKFLMEDGFKRVFWCIDSDGHVHEIERRAASLLGLSPDEADQAFEANLGDIENVVEVLEDITGVRF